MSKKKPNVVQLNNAYIDNANHEQRLARAEHQQRNRFMGWILVGVVLLFILPTYNLVGTYISVKEQEAEVTALKKSYADLKAETNGKQNLAKKLKNDDYVEKYARAKYYYSLDGETIYPAPNLLP
ncbi:FtsB family cell division protein [Streptococcus dentiloxodontae]